MVCLLGAVISCLTLVDSEAPAPTRPAEAWQALQQEFDSAFRAYNAASRDAKTDEDRRRLGARYQEQARAIADRAIALAERVPDDPVTIEVLLWVIDEVRYGAAKAFAVLARDALPSERLADACRATATAPREAFVEAENLLREARARSPHQSVRGIACYYLARELKKRAAILRRFEDEPEAVAQFANEYGLGILALSRLRARTVASLEDEAAALYRETIERYGDLPTRRKPNLAPVAEGELFDLRKLAVGQPAPEIVGTDLDGRTFKLSDYRGKVVVLTFSGSWCGPCVRMYPRERALVERFKAMPFALVSVTNDAEKAALRRAIDSGEITWRCWWDGGADGPICLRWGINTWPTVFVIDAKGVIRYRGVREERLDKAVEALLDEMPGATKSR
jgi:peroxiredoxin